MVWEFPAMIIAGSVDEGGVAQAQVAEEEFVVFVGGQWSDAWQTIF